MNHINQKWIVALLILFAFCSSVSSFAQPRNFRTMFRADPSTSMVVGWSQTVGAPTNGSIFRLFYSTTDHGTDTSAYAADNPPLEPHKIVENFKTMDHYFVRLENLLPNTAYYFVVAYTNNDLGGLGGTIGLSTQSLTERYYFETLPDNPNEPLSFISGGDSREDLEHPDQTLESITIRREANKMVSKLRPHAVFFGGDYTFASSDVEWINWLNDWELTYTSDNKITPIVAAAGNHEYAPFGGAQAGSQILTSIFDVPHPDVYYALNFGGNLLRLYTLNTEVAISGDQSDWLRGDLAATDTSVYWKMAQYHKPIRPHEAGKSDQNTAYAEWAQPFYDYQVRLVFESDAHVVKTTHELMPTELEEAEWSNEGFEADMNFVRTNNRGTVFVGEGTWAALRDGNDPKAWTRSMGGFNQVKWIWVSPDTLQVRTVITYDAEDEAYVDNIQPLNNNSRFTEPAGIQIWEPNSGRVVFITENGLSNRRPALAPVSLLPDIDLFENDGLVLVYDMLDHVSDPNNDPLQFSIVSQTNPAVVDVSISGSDLIAETQGYLFGESVVTIEITDGIFTIQDDVLVKVNELNFAPGITVPDVSINENDGEVVLFDLSLYAIDVDGDALTYELVSESHADIVSCQITNNVMTATTVPNKHGISKVVVAASDREFTTNDTFFVEVQEGLNTGINSHHQFDVKLSPNPVTQGVLQVSFDQVVSSAEIQVFSLSSGAKVFDRQVNVGNRQLTMTGLFFNPGIYIVGVRFNDQFILRKVVWE